MPRIIQDEIDDKLPPSDETVFIRESQKIVCELITQAQSVISQQIKGIENGNLSNAIRSLTESELWLGKSLKS